MYRECGLLPVPVEPGGKRPLVKWGRWQHDPPTPQELETLARKFASADIAVLLSAPPPFRSLLDVDCDGGALPSWLEESGSTLFISRRGAHCLFSRPKNMNLNYRRLDNLELRVTGIVVVPPSPGRVWVRSLDELKEPPPELLQLLVAAPSQQASLPERAPQVHEAVPQRVIEFFRADAGWWSRLAQFLSLPPMLYRNIRCPLHPPDRNPSAQLLIDRKRCVVLFCHHTQRAFTLPEIYARQRLFGPSLAVWSLRLAHAAGVLQIDVPPPPPELKDPVAAKVLAGFLELLFLRSWPKRPTFFESCPYTPRFAASWCSVSELQAKRALDFLLQQRWLTVECGVRFRLYRPGLRLLQHRRVLEGCCA
jgi:hypothetical protein